jgi:hypothetical protein
VPALQQELGHAQVGLTKICEDNEAAITTANWSKPADHSPHVDVQFFAIQDLCKAKHTILEATPATINPADALLMLRPRLLVGFFARDAFVAAWVTAKNPLKPSFIAIGLLIPLHCHSVLALSLSAVSFLVHSYFCIFHHSLFQFGALWHPRGNLVQPWFKLKSRLSRFFVPGVLLA